MTDYTIKIEDLCVEMFLGLHAFEKEKTQRVFISIELDVEGVNVSQGQFFDYDHVVDYVRGFNQQRIETQEELTAMIHVHVMVRGCRAARVYSRKPDVYPDCASVGVVYRG